MHLQSVLFTPPARITASVPQFVLNIGMRFPELLNFQFLLFYFLSLSVDFAPRILLTESFVIFYTLITELNSEIRTSSYETLTGSLPWRSFGTTDLSRWAQFKTVDLLRDEEETNVSMKITNREVGGVSVVALDGRIVVGNGGNVKMTWTFSEFPPITSTIAPLPQYPAKEAELCEPRGLSLSRRHCCSWH